MKLQGQVGPSRWTKKKINFVREGMAVGRSM